MGCCVLNYGIPQLTRRKNLAEVVLSIPRLHLSTIRLRDHNYHKSHRELRIALVKLHVWTKLRGSLVTVAQKSLFAVRYAFHCMHQIRIGEEYHSSKRSLTDISHSGAPKILSTYASLKLNVAGCYASHSNEMGI